MSANLMSLARSGGKFLKLFGDRKMMMKTMPTARDYVQDGLVAMWDGIENAGWGVHDPNATTWKDLSGNGHDLLSNGTASFGTDHAELDAIRFFYKSTDISPFFSGTGLTAQVVSTKIGDRVNCGLYSIGLDTRFLWMWSSYQQGGGKMAFSKFVYSSNVGSTYPNIASDAKTSFTLTHANGVANTFVNKTADRTASVSPLSVSGIDRIAIGKIQAYNNFKGNIYCVRHYSRALTAEEIAHNYAIDKARFNLPD